MGEAGSVEADDTRNSTELAYYEVRSAILDGTLEPGSVFSQVQLAARLGISRTPLREALRLLQTEGLVESEIRRRVRVASLDLGDLETLCAMRISLESLGVTLTVPTLSPDDLRVLRAAYQEIADALDRREFDGILGPHRQFHLGLFSHANERLVRMAADLWDHAERYRLLYTHAADDRLALAAVAQREHLAILEAAEAGEADRCGTLVAEHLARTALTVIAQRDPRREPRAIRIALREAGGTEPTANP